MVLNKIPVFFINLKHKKDRLQHTIEQLNDYGLNANAHRYGAHFTPLNGHLGCAMSHLGVLQYAKANNLEKILVLEDDFIFTENVKTVHNVFNEINNLSINQWDVVMLAYTHGLTSQSNNLNFLKSLEYAMSSSAYMVNINYYDKLIELFSYCIKNMSKHKTTQKNHEPFALDQQWLSLQKEDKWFTTNPVLGKQSLEAMGSTIQSTTNYSGEFKKYIFVLGTGRCGTMSLSKILSMQNNSIVCHEFIKAGEKASPIPINWQYNEKDFNKIKVLLWSYKKAVIGMSAFYLINYVDKLIEEYGKENTKFIVLKRDKEETVDSYYRWTDKNEYTNHWSIDGYKDNKYKNNHWDISYPKYKITDKKECIRKYYDEYYQIVDRHIDKYKNIFYEIKTEDINSDKKLLELLSWCGFDSPIIPQQIERHVHKLINNK